MIIFHQFRLDCLDLKTRKNLKLYLLGEDVHAVGDLIDHLNDNEVGAGLELTERNRNMGLVFDELKDFGILKDLVRIFIE